jgi:hypothetical protein
MSVTFTSASYTTFLLGEAGRLRELELEECPSSGTLGSNFSEVFSSEVSFSYREDLRCFINIFLPSLARVRRKSSP